jgi:hypothetical protein
MTEQMNDDELYQKLGLGYISRLLSFRGDNQRTTDEKETICRDTPRERYARDPKFKHLVDVNRMMIEKCEFTGTEIREAAMLALIMYEERHCRDRHTSITHGDLSVVGLTYASTEP